MLFSCELRKFMGKVLLGQTYSTRIRSEAAVALNKTKLKTKGAFILIPHFSTSRQNEHFAGTL